MRSQQHLDFPSPMTIAIVVLIFASTVSSAQRAEKVLHQFGTGDGQAPYGRLMSDASGNLYGTTALGGTSAAGTVFELVHTMSGNGWAENVLYNFSGGSDGAQPWGGLISDASGNLYGTTYRGGTADAGTVYELAPPLTQGGAWTQTVLHSFANGSDGFGPQSDLTFDPAGNLYGTTNNGGAPGNGIVFQLTPPTRQGDVWTENVLYRFQNRKGVSPRAAVIFDKRGALYGTLADGGPAHAGAIFRLKPPAIKGGSWTEKTIYTFSGPDGSGPLCQLLLYKGSLYGTTVIGGANNVGTVFQLTEGGDGWWAFTELHSFECGSDGCYPWAGLIVDKQGSLYGTTQFGGLPSNGGTVFQLTPSNGFWTENVVYSFIQSTHEFAAAGLLLGSGGSLFGATVGEDRDSGMVFKLLP